MKKSIFPALTFLILSFTGTQLLAQQNPADSLAGFDFIGANEHASECKTEKEKSLFLNHAKRTYKIKKYDLYPQGNGYGERTASAPIGNAKGSNNSILQGPQPVGCSNIDFESGNTTGWTIAGDFQVVTSGNDPYGGFPKVFPGGTTSLKLNDDNISGTKTAFSASATRVIPVTAINSQFQLHFAFCILNFPHPSNAAALFQVQFFDASNNLLTCPTFTCYYANPPGQFFGMPAGIAQTSTVSGQNIGYQTYPVTYVPWQTVAMDLTSYIGQNVKAVITCNWCIYNYDWGYCYIDADCFSPVPTTNTVCPGTLCGPPGMATYTWTSPPNTVSTASCISALTPGTYTLAYTPYSTCSSSVQISNYVVVPPPLATFNSVGSCGSFTFTNTGTGAPAVQTYSFLGVGAPPSYTTTSLTSSASFPPGTYTVIHTVSNGGCSATASAVVTPPPGPNPAFTTPTYTQCLLGNSFTFNAVTTAGTHTYNFNPTAGAPPTGLVNPYGPVSFTAPGTYTVNHTITVGVCTATTSSVVVINPQPTTLANNNGPLCTGSSLILTGGGGTTYSWSGPGGYTSAVQNPTLAGVTPANSGVYTVTATLNGCTSTNTTNVTVTTPSASAGNTGPYCAGATIQLNTPSASTYTWSGPAAFTSNAQNPTRAGSTVAMAGTYTILASTGTCIATATTQVVVNALPVPVANNNSPICTGAVLNFTGNGGTAYSWNGPGGYTSASQNPVIAVASSANAGTYTLTVTDINSCTNTITTNVVINSTPTIAVNNPTVCMNQTINLTSNGGASYSWSGPGAYTSSAQNPVIPNSTLPMTGAYTVTVTSATGCTNTAVANVSVNPLPTPAITSNTPCLGTTLNLNGSGGNNYVWTGPNSFSSAQQNPNISSVTNPAAGTYTIVATVGSCSASATAVISINPLPTPNIVSNSPVCIGNPLNFTGSGGVSYAWVGPAGFVDNSQNPVIAVTALSNTGNYTLTVIDVNNCVNSIVKPATVNPQPVVAAVGNTVCEKLNTTLGASGGVSYAWTGPAGFTSNNQNPSITNTGMSSVGQYTVIVTDANTCTNTAMANLIVNPAPTPNIITNSPICINNVLTLAATGGVSYSWSGPNGFISSVQNPTIMANSVSVGGSYAVTATDAKGCIATISSTTVINPNPTAQIISSPNKGCVPLCVTYTCQTPVGSTVNWNLGDGTTVMNINAGTCYHTPGVYSITTNVVDVNGCPGSSTYTAEIYPNPIADYNYAPLKPIENQDDVTFTDASYGATITGWSWYFMNTTQYTSTHQNPVFNYPEAGSYAVALVVKSDKGCLDTVVKSLVVGEDFGIWVPDAFTPNGDGLNDLFYAKGFGVTKFEMQIFDRWGETIFASGDINNAWDGKYQTRGDNACPEDIYVWRVKVTSVFGKAKEITGHVTLIK